MSLADRLAAAQRERGVGGPDGGPTDGGFTSAAPRARRSADPFADLKREVHQTLLDTLGPKLYDSRLTQPSSSSRSGRPCRRCSPRTRPR